MHKGEYMFTLDTCLHKVPTLDTNFPMNTIPAKTFNIIKLDNGQIAPQSTTELYLQTSFTTQRKTPTSKVCTQNYIPENTPKWSVGHTDDWAYKDKGEGIKD